MTKDEHLLEMLLGVGKSERSLTMWLCVCAMLGRVLSLPPLSLNATIPTLLDDKTEILECNTSFRKRNVSQSVECFSSMHEALGLISSIA